MIRVVMFDLGETLVDANRKPFPHAHEAVSAIVGFETADGKPLQSCLVSDFTMPSPPSSPAKVKKLFDDYLTILKSTGFADLFTPHDRRVTLSTHAGFRKPDKRVFETALKRLKSKAALSECLFITENATHISAAHAIGLTALRFGGDFTDWSTVPALVAALVAPQDAANQKAAIRVRLEADGFDLLSITPQILANRWHAVLVPGFDEVEVPIPVDVKLTRDSRGAITAAQAETPSAEAVAEAKSFVRSLADNGQLSGLSASHEIVTTADGHRRLVRRGYARK